MNQIEHTFHQQLSLYSHKWLRHYCTEVFYNSFVNPEAARGCLLYSSILILSYSLCLSSCSYFPLYAAEIYKYTFYNNYSNTPNDLLTRVVSCTSNTTRAPVENITTTFHTT